MHNAAEHLLINLLQIYHLFYIYVCVCVSVLGSPLLSVLSSHTIQNLVACPSPYLQQTALSEVNIPKSLLKAVEKSCSY